MGTSQGREPPDTLRGLTATGPSKVGVDKAMRARDVSRAHDRDVEVTGDGDRPAADDEDEARDQSAGGSGSAGSSPVSS